jgi:hypothetical protein
MRADLIIDMNGKPGQAYRIDEAQPNPLPGLHGHRLGKIGFAAASGAVRVSPDVEQRPVGGIRQKIPTAAHRALRGDLTGATLDALRDAPGPMTTKELARHVMAERGLNSADISLLQRHVALRCQYPRQISDFGW